MAKAKKKKKSGKKKSKRKGKKLTAKQKLARRRARARKTTAAARKRGYAASSTIYKKKATGKRGTTRKLKLGRAKALKNCPQGTVMRVQGIAISGKHGRFDAIRGRCVKVG